LFEDLLFEPTKSHLQQKKGAKNMGHPFEKIIAASLLARYLLALYDADGKVGDPVKLCDI